MAGFTVKSGKTAIGNTATKISDIVTLKRGHVVILVPGATQSIYLGDSTVTTTTGMLLPSVGITLERMPGYDEYKTDEIYVIGTSGGDVCYATVIVGG